MFMRLLNILLLIFIASGSFAQKINGFIKNVQGAPISGTTISLLKAADSAVVKLAISNDSGFYNFTGVQEGNYLVSASHTGYQPVYSAPFSISTADNALPDLVMQAAATGMQAVTVTARKPLIEVKADKTILNVEGTINATGSDALELLRRSPGVIVDKDDRLSMSGKNGVKIYVDGRPSPLAGQDLSAWLKSLQSSQIESIQLITNPSAKYDAAGNAGIINIVLKKNNAFGTNGSVNAGWNIGTYAKYNGGLSLNHRNKKVNIFGSYSAYKRPMESHMDSRRTISDTLFDQRGLYLMKSTGHNFKTGIDYFPNKKTTLGVMVNGSLNNTDLDNYSRTPIIHRPNGITNRILVADNNGDSKSDNININLNYVYTYGSDKSLTINGDYGFHKKSNSQLQSNNYLDAVGGEKIRSLLSRMITPTRVNLYSWKADYEQNLGKGKLETGGKISWANTDNDFQQYNIYASGQELDKDRSNRFRYTENIHAVYVNYNRSFKGFTIQAGLRAENTHLEGNSNGLKKSGTDYTPYESSFKRNYTDLFPSAAVNFNKNPMSQFSLTFSRRIDRPAYSDLNPFELKIDDYMFIKGNINLRPQYTNSFGLTHIYKGSLTTTLNYSLVKDMFTALTDTAETSKAVLSSLNLATQKVLSLNVSYMLQYKSFMSYMNMNTNYSKYEANMGPGRTINRDAINLSFFAQNSLRFAKTWTAELTGYYYSPFYTGTSKYKAMWSMDAGLQKQILKGKATIKTALSDVFRTLKYREVSDFAGQQTISNTSFESRLFKLGISYRFGNTQVKAARQRNTGLEDEQKRTQGGTGNKGIK
jgi:iron complex outermembrane receptor protein